MHDWTRVDAGLYHNFHQSWTIRLMDALNSGVFPTGYFAMANQRVAGPEPDLAAYRHRHASPPAEGGTTLATPRPKVWREARLEPMDAAYARKANRLSVRDARRRAVAIIKIVSPGNNSCRARFRKLLEKSARFVQAGVHLLIVDPFPPGRRDPEGFHQALADELGAPLFDPLPDGKPLTALAVEAAEESTIFVEPFGVGDPLPEMPLFLEPGWHVPAPLEASYAAAWAALPPVLKREIENPQLV